MAEISKLACVDPNAKIGEGVSIGPFCVVGPEVTLGDKCVLYNHVTIDGHTEIGRENVFYQNVVVGVAPAKLSRGSSPCASASRKMRLPARGSTLARVSR